uniref:(northern house mosquito) hypothetical protein n=1 Tax=Culex pipiens TaxID=7175 RepID=A0A8D8HWE3_CULPI
MLDVRVLLRDSMYISVFRLNSISICLFSDCGTVASVSLNLTLRTNSSNEGPFSVHLVSLSLEIVTLFRAFNALKVDVSHSQLNELSFKITSLNVGKTLGKESAICSLFSCNHIRFNNSVFQCSKLISLRRFI